MSSFLCDTCDAEYPGGASGTSLLVVTDGRTCRFCSGACLRAHVNQAIKYRVGEVVILASGLSAALGLAIGLMVGR